MVFLESTFRSSRLESFTFEPINENHRSSNRENDDFLHLVFLTICPHLFTGQLT